MQAAIDLGITNIHVITGQDGDLAYTRLLTTQRPILEQVEGILATLLKSGSRLERAAITGGQYRNLPPRVSEIELIKVNEVTAIGRGGLALSRLDQALVASAGSGTAMVAAREKAISHVTGSAVGGGTLQGLGRLLLGTADPLEIDRLALQGDANQADLTLVETVGGAVGRLPLDANAVNFGRLAGRAIDLSPTDTAAALVRLIGQVIAVIAINAAHAEGLETVVVTGHLVDLLSVRKVLNEVAGYYQADIRVPPQPGSGTALGALLCLEDNPDNS
jgi:type II pantothenate kinase